jgi:hypothetical protein
MATVREVIFGTLGRFGGSDDIVRDGHAVDEVIAALRSEGYVIATLDADADEILVMPRNTRPDQETYNFRFSISREMLSDPAHERFIDAMMQKAKVKLLTIAEKVAADAK